MLSKIPIITIDGPSGSGKGTISRALAKILKWKILDSGMIYRALTFSALRNNINIESEELLVSLATNLNISFITHNNETKLLFDGIEITKELFTLEISDQTSRIALLPQVRQVLIRKQRSFVSKPGLIADGRDMGTMVFPDAPVKIFLDATIEERTHRRMLQLRKDGFHVSFNTIINEIKKRDERDYTRLVSPLVYSKDAFLVDSTNISIKQVIDKVLEYASKKLYL